MIIADCAPGITVLYFHAPLGDLGPTSKTYLSWLKSFVRHHISTRLIKCKLLSSNFLYNGRNVMVRFWPDDYMRKMFLSVSDNGILKLHPTGIEPMTFRLVIRILHRWAIRDLDLGELSYIVGDKRTANWRIWLSMSGIVVIKRRLNYQPLFGKWVAGNRA